jgi:hypothetical protein
LSWRPVANFCQSREKNTLLLLLLLLLLKRRAINFPGVQCFVLKPRECKRFLPSLCVLSVESLL